MTTLTREELKAKFIDEKADELIDCCIETLGRAEVVFAFQGRFERYCNAEFETEHPTEEVLDFGNEDERFADDGQFGVGA